MGDGVVLSGVVLGYGRRSPVLSGVDLAVPAGGFAAVVGPNGGGKSTLLRALAGLAKPRAGTVRVGGVDPAALAAKERARRIAFLGQDEPDDAPYSVLDLVLCGRFPWQGFFPADRPEDVRIAERALEQVGLESLRDRRLGTLSGGERQRVHLARALAQEPKLLLLDEPAAALDLRFQVEIWSLLRDLHRRTETTIVVVSHDLNLPAQVAETVVVVADGGIRRQGRPEEVLRASVLEPVYRTPLVEIAMPGRRLPLVLARGLNPAVEESRAEPPLS